MFNILIIIIPLEEFCPDIDTHTRPHARVYTRGWFTGNRAVRSIYVVRRERAWRRRFRDDSEIEIN